MPDNNIKLFEFELSTVMENEDGETVLKTGVNEYAAYYDESKTSPEEICALLEKNGVDGLKDFKYAVVLERETANKLAALVTNCNDANVKSLLKNDMNDTLSLLEKSTSIKTSLSTSVQRGLYCLINAYGLMFRVRHQDNSEYIELYDNDKNPDALGADAIKSRKFDEEKFNTVHNQIVFMNMINDKIETLTSRLNHGCEYGWLSPNGEFERSVLGHHDEDAEEIIAKHSTWKKSYKLYLNSADDGCASEYLMEKQGYALIQAPPSSSRNMTPQVISPEGKNLTLAQLKFLHDYFETHGEHECANAFLPDSPLDRKNG